MFEKAKEIDKTANAKKVRKTTEDGFKIYTMEELGIGKGGDTELCPFDCDCCFWISNILISIISFKDFLVQVYCTCRWKEHFTSVNLALFLLSQNVAI